MGFNILTAVALISSTIPPVLRSTTSAPNVALQNAMACRVYRLLKLGRPEDDISIYFNSQAPKSSISFVPGSTTSEWGAQIARAAGRLPPSPRQASDSRFLESTNDETELEEYSSKHSVDRGIEAIV